ncbi:MAG: DUF4842 domain-containing protein [Bacteroidaceae bacterium]|nr:DUF4842 domain-containing protein [Bacteroidaceae bacterium]
MFVMAACVKDYYDPEYMQQQARSVFPIRNVDANHTWETVSLVNATVDADTDRSLYIYQGNPYSESDDARLLAIRKVTAGHSTFTFDAPLALDMVFVAILDDNGLSEARTVTIENGQMVLSLTQADNARQHGAPMHRIATYDDSWVTDVVAENTTYFPTSVPAGAKLYKGEWSTTANMVYYIEGNSCNQISIGNTADFYISGEVTLNSISINKPWGVNANTAHIYLLPNAKLHLPQGMYAAYDAEVSVGAGATLDCGTSTIQFANDLGVIYNAGTITSGKLYSSSPRQIYNLGTMNIGGECNITNFYVMNKGTFASAGKLDINNSTMFINEGTLSVSSKLQISNAESKLINRGIVEAGSYSLEGGGYTKNEAGGVVTIASSTALTSTNSSWDNEGQWTTETFSLTSISNNWINACQLYVKGNFYCSLSDGDGGLNIDGGGYMECATANISNIRINLGSKAQFNCKGTATFGWTNPSYQGFYGVGSELGVVRLKKAVEANSGKANAMQYGGNLIVACDDHFKRVLDGDAGYNYKIHGDNVSFTSYSGGLFSIDATTCAPELTPQPATLPTTPQIYTYAFEDMTLQTGDFDFNDVVFTLSSPIDNKVTLTLLAVGATKTMSLCWKRDSGNSDNIETIFADLHSTLAVPQGQITNTFQDGHNYATPVSTVIEVPEGFTLAANGDFFIADSYGTVHLPSFTEGFVPGDVPYAICVPGQWLWPVEFMVVNEAYPEFSLWAQDATQDMLWYDTPVESRIVK